MLYLSYGLIIEVLDEGKIIDDLDGEGKSRIYER